MRFRALTLPVLVTLAACSTNPPPSATAPAAAAATAPASRELTGTWDFSVDAGGQIIPGEMNITRSGTSYGGTLVPQGMDQATIRSATVTGDRVVITVDTPNGEAIVNATFNTDGRSFAGSVVYNGQTLGFTARRR